MLLECINKCTLLEGHSSYIVLLAVKHPATRKDRIRKMYIQSAKKERLALVCQP